MVREDPGSRGDGTSLQQPFIRPPSTHIPTMAPDEIRYRIPMIASRNEVNHESTAELVTPDGHNSDSYNSSVCRPTREIEKSLTRFRP